MAFENGVDWRPQEPQERGRHASFRSALEAVRRSLSLEAGDFFELLADRWGELFPGLPARPGRRDGDRVFLYVRSAPLLFSVRPKLREVKRVLARLPGAPRRFSLSLEIHK